MKNYKFLGLFILYMLGQSCKPEPTKNINFKISQNAIVLAGLKDSLTNADKDGLDFQPLNTGNYRNIPEELTKLLNNDFTKWTLPNFSNQKLKKLHRNMFGPLYLEADFNADGETDYAVQILNNDSLKIVAYLKFKNSASKIYLLESHSLTPSTINTPNGLYLTMRESDIKKKNKLNGNPIIVTDGKKSRFYNFHNKQVYTTQLNKENN